MYVPKNKGESSSKETADLKSISIHPNLFAIIKEPFVTNEFFDLVPKSLIINKNKEIPKDGRCIIEELPTDTSILHHAFISIFIALWTVISLYVTILMAILSYFTRFT